MNGLALVKNAGGTFRRIRLAYLHGEAVSDTLEKLPLCTIEIF